MINEKIDLGDGKYVEIKITHNDHSVTVSQQHIAGTTRALKNCSVTCYDSAGHAKSLSWTCPDNKTCQGDCSDPANPKGGCI